MSLHTSFCNDSNDKPSYLNDTKKETKIRNGDRNKNLNNYWCIFLHRQEFFYCARNTFMGMGGVVVM